MTGVRARWLLLLALGIVLASAPLLCADEAAPADDQAIAASLAKMLQAARSVISNNQPLINDPSIGDKGLSGKVVLARTLEVYRTNTGTDPLAGDQMPMRSPGFRPSANSPAANASTRSASSR